MSVFRTHHGFSLAELLIALTLLGLVSVFTVPKLFNAPSSTISSKQTAMARNAAFMVLAAYEQYRHANPTMATTFRSVDFMPYINYVSVAPTSLKLDTHASTGGIVTNYAGTMGAQDGVCLNLHNGEALWLCTDTEMVGTSSLNTISFRFDPNGAYDGAVNDASGMSLQFQLYYDGTIKSRGSMSAGTIVTSAASHVPTAGSPAGNEDPSWFTGFN